MASTIKSATMTISLQEKIVLNGKEQGSVYEYTIGSINETSRRIMTVPTSEITAVTLGATAGAGTFVRANVKYMRFTNLDDTNFVRLAMTQDGSRADVKLAPKETFILTSTQLSVATPFANLTDITGINLIADSAACDVELFVASV